MREATIAECDAGTAWYSVARSEVASLAERYRVSSAVAAGVVAVLSPMVRWERNLVEAERVLKRRTAGHDYTQDGHSAFPRNVRKAYDIVDLGRAEGVVSGRKVSNFFRLLCSPCDALVLDSIAILAAVGIDPNPLVTSDDAKLYFGRKRTLDTIERAYRAVAEEQGLRPDQVQAIVWTVWRNERDKA
jgi:hypothetical protein